MSSSRSARPVARTLLLSTALYSTVLAIPHAEPAGVALNGGVPFVLLVAMFLAAGMMLFHISFGEDTHSFSLAEVPLVVGLFLTDPWTLLAARLCGEALALVLLPRQPPLKVVLNLSVFVAETCTALAVLHALVRPEPESPTSWLAAVLAVAAAAVVTNGAVHAVIRWHGGQPELRPLVVSALATTTVNSALGLVAVVLLEVHLAGVVLLGVVGGTLGVGYRGYSRLRQRYASLRLLHGFSEAIGGATRPADVTEAMLHHARVLLRADVAEMTVLAPGARHTRAPGDVHALLRGARPTEYDDSGADRAALLELAAGTALLAPRGTTDPVGRRHLERLGCSDGLLATTRLDDGSTLLIGVGDRLDDVSTFDHEDQRLLETLVTHAAMALDKGRLIDALRTEVVQREHQAMHDPLTDLPNRRCFGEGAAALVEAARGRGSRLAVLLMDLDGFKEVNDTLGHQTGDELLHEVGRRLAGVVADGDLAARLGGDEFAMVLDLGFASEADPAQVLEAAHRVLRAVEEPVRLRGVDLDVRASLGIALFPDHGDVGADLLQRADIAMYQAKRSGERLALYVADLDTHTPWRLQLASDLRRGIDEGQLVVHYQPKADLRTGAIVAAEALVRWQHPEHGRIRPDEFIPVAEQVGLITPLTWVVLDAALSDAARWDRDGLALSVAVNVSVRSLLEAGFVDRVLASVAASGLPATRLTLELTESSIMGDSRRTLEVLEQLAGAGVALSVDDFGTGYSSLSYLQRLPVSELKVDRSFVFSVASSPSDRAIVQSVVDLGHSLGLRVVAEGMENQLTWDHLVSMGCDLGQGYLLSPPLAAEDLERWLTARQAAATPPVPARR